MADGARKDARITAEAVFEPWELTGESRRDCLPHRAGLLMTMAYASLIAGGLSFACLLLGLIGLALGAVTWMLAGRDLDHICSGHMDHRGYSRTQKARSDARAAVFLGLVGSSLWIVLATLFIRSRLFPL